MPRLLNLLVAAALTALVACGGGSPTQPSGSGPPPATPPIVVAFGDSLTEGPGLTQAQTYPAVLQQKIRDAGLPHVVVNRGVSGDTTADGVRRLNAALLPEARVLIVAFGANDGIRGVGVDDVRRNLSTIIEAAQQRQMRVLLCGMQAPPTRGLQYAFEFHRIFPDLAQQYNIPLMPFLLAGVFGVPSMNLANGFHPNAAGAQRIADNMWPYLEPLLR